MSAYHLDDEQTFRDDLAERRRDRDRHREPRATGIIRHITPRVTQGARFMLGVDPSSVRLSCPRCNGPVYAAGDSAGERLDCATCDARLLTRTDIDGQLSVVDTGTGGAE